jgi:Ca-activated chloride channel family protein
MAFAWPFALLLLLAVPAALGAYLLSLSRRRKQAVSYSSVALLRSVIPRHSRWRRHLPVALLVASLGVLAVASARPQVSQDVPLARTSIILALDVSRSMCATDVDPNRLAAAQRATRAFVKDEVPGTRTGIIVFAGTAQLAVAPTRDHTALLRAIDGLSTANGTAIGAAILKSLDALSTVNQDVKPVGDILPGVPPPPASSPPGRGGYVPDIVVLMTDGANNRGIPPLDAVPYAVERRVRVYTIGFGTTEPAPLVCTTAQLGGEEGGAFGGGFGGPGGGGGAFGGFGAFRGRSPLRADLPTLQQVADRTGGQAYTAQDASQLQKVFAQLPRDVTVQKRRQEITVWFAVIGALLTAAAIGASIRWSPYP